MKLVSLIAQAILYLLLALALAYIGIASAVFQFRNPTANSFSLYRDFTSVVRFEKLPEYQPKK
jgi:hypothetical protein